MKKIKLIILSSLFIPALTGIVFASESFRTFSNEDMEYIGLEIWGNEAAGPEGIPEDPLRLAFWGKYHQHPRFGIGGFSWLPTNYHPEKDNYEGEFPLLCKYLQKHEVPLPAWLQPEELQKTKLKWELREDFLADSVRRQALCDLFVQPDVVALQVAFMQTELDKDLVQIQSTAKPEYKEVIGKYVRTMRNSARGNYVLMDYRNFMKNGIFAVVPGASQDLAEIFASMAVSRFRQSDSQAVMQRFKSMAAVLLMRQASNFKAIPTEKDIPLKRLLVRRVDSYTL